MTRPRRASAFLVILLLGLLLPFVSGAKPVIIIDAGHGGHDRGGGPRQKIPEKPYALDVSIRLQKVLSKAGYRTVMTRKGDYFVTLGNRCAIANKTGGVFVSIHFNSAQREGANGIETYYYGSKSGKLAAAIHREVVRTARTEDRNVRRRGFYVLRNTRTVSVLCELGFLTNRAEGKRIAGSASYRQSLAEAVARGVMKVY